MDTPEKRRWYRPCPAWLIYGSLAVTGLLFASERWRWFWFNEHKGYTVLIAVAGVGVVLLLMLLWWLVALVFRGRFQFGIRSLLVLTLAVALPFSWMATQISKGKQQEALAEEMQRRGWSVDYNGQLDANGNMQYCGVEPSGPRWLRRVLGDGFFGTILCVYSSHATDADLEFLSQFSDAPDVGFDSTVVTDAGLAALQGFTPLKWVRLIGNEYVTDAGIKHLSASHRLERLSLDGTNVSDEGLCQLVGLIRLRLLSVTFTKVTDAGLKYVGQLSGLQILLLDLTQVTDSGLEYLKSLSQLQQVQFGGTKVTAEGVRKLQQALPNCKIYR